MNALLAHHVSWELHHGPIPKGLHVLHKCDIPACVNPDHLFLGTQADNMRDKVKKGRQPYRRGEEVQASRLTAQQVVDIRHDYALGVETHRSLGKKYGVSHHTIGVIVRRNGWTHLE